MGVMVTSFRGSVDDWLVQLLPADLYLRIEPADTGGLSGEIQEQLRAAPGVASMSFRKTTLIRLAPDRPAVALLARTLEHPGVDLPLLGAPLSPPAGEIAVWISEPMHWLYQLKPGDHLELPLGSKLQSLFVAGVWRDYSRQHGALILDRADYIALGGDGLASEAAIDLLPGSEASSVISAIKQRLPGALRDHVDIGRPGEIRALALKIFDRSFAVTYALEAIAILVGLSGVAATLSAQTLARSKEFGMLRHIGVKRRQIIAMLACEGVLLGGLGMTAGLALGLAMSQVLIHVVNPQSFHWTMQTRLPLGLFAALAVAMATAAALTALLAGRHALSAAAIRAVREDW
jgi:putative ABC transport system permease protein